MKLALKICLCAVLIFVAAQVFYNAGLGFGWDPYVAGFAAAVFSVGGGVAASIAWLTDGFTC